MRRWARDLRNADLQAQSGERLVNDCPGPCVLLATCATFPECSGRAAIRHTYGQEAEDCRCDLEETDEGRIVGFTHPDCPKHRPPPPTTDEETQRLAEEEWWAINDATIDELNEEPLP